MPTPPYASRVICTMNGFRGKVRGTELPTRRFSTKANNSGVPDPAGTSGSNRGPDPCPRAGSSWRRSSVGFELGLFHDQIDPRSLTELRAAPLELALVVEAPLVVVFHRLGTIFPWGHTAYAWPTTTEASHTQDLVRSRWTQGTRTVLDLSIVRGTSSRVAIHRRFLLDQAFSEGLHDAIRNQALTPFDGDAYVRSIACMGLGAHPAEHLATHAPFRTVATEIKSASLN